MSEPLFYAVSRSLYKLSLPGQLCLSLDELSVEAGFVPTPGSQAIDNKGKQKGGAIARS